MTAIVYDFISERVKRQSKGKPKVKPSKAVPKLITKIGRLIEICKPIKE
jgi:hypothetical protein